MLMLLDKTACNEFTSLKLGFKIEWVHVLCVSVEIEWKLNWKGLKVNELFSNLALNQSVELTHCSIVLTPSLTQC